LKLPGVQEDLAQALLATGKPVAVVLVMAALMLFPPWPRGKCDSGSVVAGGRRRLCSGRCFVWRRRTRAGNCLSLSALAGQVPIYYNAKPAGMKSNWYVDYVSEKVTPLYPFGHGLSYTSFEYKDLVIKQSEQQR